MLFGSNNKQRKILTVVLAAFIVVNVFGIILLAPTPAYAQWVVTDPITGANTTIRNITDFVRVVLVGVMGTALLNGIWYFSQKIAYDSAVWIASGNKGQDALIFQEGFGTYLENVSLDAVGEVIRSIDIPGFDLCRPTGNLSAIMAIQLGIAQRFQPPTPRCAWNDLSSNWESFVSSATSDEVLSGLSNVFRPGQSGLDMAFTLNARSHEFSLRRELEATEDRREGGGFKPVSDPISGSIVTPADAVKQKHQEIIESGKKQREASIETAGSALAAGAFQLLPATLTIFTNTLLSSLTKNIFSGLYSPSAKVDRGSLFNPEASQKAVGGRARAQAVFADLLTPKFVEVQNYDALTEFMTCPGKNRGSSNCVIDSAFASIVRISESGVPVTVSDAMRQGALHPDWVLIPGSDAGNNQDPNCYTHAYCYSNLAKLRRARIIPIGWELAAEQGARLGVKPTLQEVASHFYDCDLETGGVSDSHPWCHLIDPNWVLKYPPTQCKALVKGPTLLAAEASVRTDTCVDSSSCIATDDKGNCTAYGYCTKESNVWNMPGESCPARYESCESYRKTGANGKQEKETFLLTNTLDFGKCTAEAAGCSWYASARTPGGTTEEGWQNSSRVYLNRNAETCGASDDGCSDLILKGAGVSKNLIRNSSFEVAGQAAGTVAFWNVANAGEYSVDGTQSYRGNAAIRLGDGAVRQDQDTPLEPETTYTFSIHSKQAVAGGNAEVDAQIILRDGANALVDMAGRTNCSFAIRNGVPDSRYTTLNFVPRDSYSRSSCSFTTPSGSGFNLASLIIFGDIADAIWIDSIQLEEGVLATDYRENGYPQNAAHASYKAPPAYLGCTGAANDPVECKNYALVCAPEDANCELYTPSDGSPSVPGIATSDKICPAECVGYSTFRQEPTRFEGAEYPLFFIPKTGDKCEAQYAGCDQFTNLETSSVEYYTYLRQCVRPGADTDVYYTWEGSDTTGFQLKVWNLLSGAAQAGESGRPPVYRTGFTNYGRCTRDIFQSGFDSDCREFYDEQGNISYRLYSEVVVATPDCNRYRRTEASANQNDCTRSGGEWDAGLSSCTFLGYPNESVTCPAEKNLCRAYTGNAGRNFRIIKEARFEDGSTEGFEGALSSESIFVGGHSLQTVQVPGVQNRGTTRVSVSGGDTQIRVGGTYILTFIAKGSGRPVIRFSGDEGNTNKYFTNGSIDIRSDWQKYSLGPILVERTVLDDEELVMTSLGNPTFIDDIELREVSENIYIIKDSWNTPASCDLAADGITPFPQAMLGCSEYKDTKNISVNLTGFDRLCKETAVGCRAVINTYNSESLEEERYNLACVLPDGDDAGNLPDVCSDLSCPCSATVQDEVRVVCQVGRSETSCRFNSIGEAAGAAVAGVNYSVEVRPDSVIVPADETKYLVLSSDKACRPEKAGCTLYGNPAAGVCSLPDGADAGTEPDICAAAGCNCLINSDVVCKVANGAASCSYKIPRYYLAGAGANYSPVVLKNDPAKYGGILCTDEFLGCTEWQKGKNGLAYFKDPVEQICEYRENVSSQGATKNGWFKKGMDAEPCDPAFAVGGTEYNIRKNGDIQYLGWSGMCSRQYAGCTAFLDPADKSSSYPEGKPYYVIKDERLNEGNDCSGRVSQKEGCVLFKDTSVSASQYSSEATYAVSENQNYGLVSVSSCPDGAGCKRCLHSYLNGANLTCGGGGGGGIGGIGNIGVFDGMGACREGIYGGTCTADSDCERDTPVYPRGTIPVPISSTCVIPAVGAGVPNDANTILKVARDRSCSEWLDCKTSVTVWDDGLKKFKKVCTQLGRCDSYVTTADGVKCANYKSSDYSGDLLTLGKYVGRDVSWYGEEYSGYSIPGHYPTEELYPVDYDKTAETDMRLAYIACEETSGADRNCDRRTNAPAGACHNAGSPCGEPNSVGASGTCVSSGVPGAAPLCIYGIDGRKVAAQSENQRAAEARMPINRSLPKEQCRAYPEQDSPFPASISEWTQNGLPLGRISGFQQANVCEKFAWRDIDGDGVRDTFPAWPDPRTELIPQDCECSYSKAIYNGKSFTKYFNLEGDIVPGGICQGGPRSGEVCVPGAAYNDKKDARDSENLKTCGPQNQGGFCQKIERIDTVIGQFGQCLEQDLSLSLNGVQNNYACLTWNPLDIVPGGRDIYNQFSSAGYAPSGNTGKYFCLESQGNMKNQNQAYESRYSSLGFQEIPLSLNRDGDTNDLFYQENFITDTALEDSDNPRPQWYEKDIAAIKITTDFAGDNFVEGEIPDDALKAAIEKAQSDGTNILSRQGKTGITPSGKYYWEATFNIPTNESARLFERDEQLLNSAGYLDNTPESVNRGTVFTTEQGSSVCANSFPGQTYFAVRALFDNTQARRFLGLWTSYCDQNRGGNVGTFTMKSTFFWLEPCMTIAKVEGSNAAFTDRTWSASGYTVSDESDIEVAEPTNFGSGVPNIPGSPFGAPPTERYPETFMLGYGYENRNTPFGSAATTLEPFGIEAWQITGPDGFGSPYTKYISSAPDAGSPYGQSREGTYFGGVMRCAGSPYVPGSALVSLNEGQLCQARTECPLQKVCYGDDGLSCTQDSECPNDGVCSAKRCGLLDSDNFTVLDGFLGRICTDDEQCEFLGDDYKCLDQFAFADCTTQTRPFGLGVVPRTNENSVNIRTTRQTPLEFLFAKSFGIWKWSANAGTVSYGICTGNTPEAGNPCDKPDGSQCSDTDGTCTQDFICNQGPQKGASCSFGHDNQCNGNDVKTERGICQVQELAGDCSLAPPPLQHPGQYCENYASCYDANRICSDNRTNEMPTGCPLVGETRTVEHPGEFCETQDDCFDANARCYGNQSFGVCPSDSDHPNIACNADNDCYNDDAICNLTAQVHVCTGGVFEDSIITDIGACPDGWRKETGECRLPCADNDECLYTGATCGSEGRCDADSGALKGVSCTISGNAQRDNSACQYLGICQLTEVPQQAGYQKLQSTAENPAPVGWDNREEATLGEQPYPPVIASPDISSCDPQSQKCHISGIMPGLSDIDCDPRRGNRDCLAGWSCVVRSDVAAFGGVNGDTDNGSGICVPPQTLDLNAVSINNRTSGDLRGAGSYRAVLRFYAWADHNTMPIASRAVNWGDGVVERTTDSKYKNHKPICSGSDDDSGASKECGGMPGLTCAKQSDCPVGTGLCTTVGRCSSSRTRCSVSEDCPLSASGVERCVLSRFGNSADACNEEYFEFEHTYVCTTDFMSTLPRCTGAELDPTNRNPGFAACKRDLNNDNRADVCIFRPKVQVKDNWGYCNGVCPSNSRDASPGGLRCFESECDRHPGAWTGFGGFITIAPRN